MQRGKLQLAAVKQRLQFLKRDHAVHIGRDAGTPQLGFFCRAGPDKHHLGSGVAVLDGAADLRHGRKIVRYIRQQRRKRCFNIAHERRAAAAREQTLFYKLARLLEGDHIRAERGLDHGMEAQRLDARNDLPELCVGELARNGGRDGGIHAEGIRLRALPEQPDHIENVRFFRERAERALIDARAAGNALVVVDGRVAPLVHGDCADLTGVLAGALVVLDRAVWADACAAAAVDALFLVDDCLLVRVEPDRSARADVLAAVRKAAAAVLGHGVAAGGAFVTGDVERLDHVGVFGVAAHGEFDTLGEDRAFFIDAAAHGRLPSGDDGLRDVQQVLVERPVPCKACDLAQHLVFHVLYLGVEFA
ncbi:unknown [Clostridium sp. CAG:1024]|nr:unknown [Clostridium sp. CAG:1024]